MTAVIARRAWLGGVGSTLGALVGAGLGLGLGGCAGAAPKPAPPPPRVVPALVELLAAARLGWVIRVRPRELAGLPWLRAHVNEVVPDTRFEVHARLTGFDLRELDEAIVAQYADDEGGAMLYLLRHAGDPARIESAFRERLVSDQVRSVDGHELVRVTGKVGRGRRTLVLLGRDTLALQHGGSASRGPARVAALFADKKLVRSPTAFMHEPLAGLAKRFGDVPASAYALGPFEGELARGARGMLAGAVALGMSVRPSVRKHLAVTLAVAGDFSGSGPRAQDELAAAWDDLAATSFGKLLGLDKPIERSLATHGADAVAIAVELDAARLTKGLVSATSAEIKTIME